MRILFRHFWLPIYRCWALWHIRRERTYVCAGLRLRVPPGVFHPGIFFSTPIFISFLREVDFQQKKVLDVGTGSGALALFAARMGAIATALDINPVAVETARRNAEANGLRLTVIESDVFGSLPFQPFDFVLVNPPYYPRSPRDLAERAFFAGENLEYFEALFGRLPPYLNPQTRVWLILSEDCDFWGIKEIAARNGFSLRVVFEKKKWGERFFVAQAGS
ncbi:MAG: methyltransferase [Saprospiraceae bacterium]